MNMSVHINHCTAFLTTFIYISAYFSCRHILQSPYISGCPFLAQDYPIKTRILSVSGANLNSVTYFFRIANILTALFSIFTSIRSKILFQRLKKWGSYLTPPPWKICSHPWGLPSILFDTYRSNFWSLPSCRPHIRTISRNCDGFWESLLYKGLNSIFDGRTAYAAIHAHVAVYVTAVNCVHLSWSWSWWNTKRIVSSLP